MPWSRGPPELGITAYWSSGKDRKGDWSDPTMIRLTSTRTARRFGGRVREGVRRLRPLFERRKSGRVKAESIVGCSLGRVMNLSTGGIRVRTRRRLGVVITVDLSTSTGRVRVRCEVVWTRRQGFGRYLNGLRFVEVTPAISRQISMLTSVI